MTLFSVSASILGNIVAFMVGPALVPDTNATSTNITKAEVQKEIQVFMGLESGVCLALLLAFIVYYPARPPTPPSASASVPRTNFKDGLKALVTDRNVVLSAFAYSSSGGVNGAWQVLELRQYKNGLVSVKI